MASFCYVPRLHHTEHPFLARHPPEVAEAFPLRKNAMKGGVIFLNAQEYGARMWKMGMEKVPFVSTGMLKTVDAP